MTRERVLLLLTTLPDPPEGSRLGWLPWDVQWRDPDQMEPVDVFCFCFARDERHGGTGLAVRVSIVAHTVDQAFDYATCDESALAALDVVAKTRMKMAEDELTKMVPVYVAEKLIERK